MGRTYLLLNFPHTLVELDWLDLYDDIIGVYLLESYGPT
jgi:hypothetical protein